MGDRNKGAPPPIAIESWEQYEQLMLEDSQTKLIVIDCYQEWCGPTTAMQAFWNQQWLAIETPVDRLAIYNLCINAPDVDEKTVNAVSKAGASDGIRLQTQGCRPFSILLRFGAAVSAVDGVNPTNMNMMLDLHLPKVIKKKAEGEA